MARVSISVDGDHLDSIDAVAAALRNRGMEVDQVLGAIGVITGSVPDSRRPELADVDGVASVDEETQFRLPPPESPLQ